MRAGDSIIKRLLVVSLSAVYLLIAVTYLLYLPKYSLLRTTGAFPRVNSQPVLKTSRKVNQNAANVLVLVHRAYRSAVENKREMFSALSQIGLIFVSVITSGIALLYLTRITARPLKLAGTKRYAYLNYCTLRI